MSSSAEPHHGPPPDVDVYSGDKLIAISVIFVILNTIFVIGRVVSRRLKKDSASWGLDDVLLLPSYSSCIGMCALGFGKENLLSYLIVAVLTSFQSSFNMPTLATTSMQLYTAIITP